jgi:hypothetical protein
LHIDCDSDESSSQINKANKKSSSKKYKQQEQQESKEQLNDDLDDSQSICSSKLYELNKGSKRWRSMYALRDSIRNLTSCVTSRSHIQQKYVSHIYLCGSHFHF